MSNHKTVVVGGGLGPMAGVFFHKKIIENTNGEKGDQGQLDVIHISRSRGVAERIAFLAGRSTVSPAVGMVESIKLATAGLQVSGSDAVISIPCNTFHAPQIFDHFLDLLKKENIGYEVLHIVDETVCFVVESKCQPKKVGVLGTIGTRESGLFHAAFERVGIDVVDIAMDLQHELSDLILHIKRVNRICDEHVVILQRFISSLGEAGAELVVLGCTELSMIVDEPLSSKVPYVDPVIVLARKTVEKCGGAGSLAEV